MTKVEMVQKMVENGYHLFGETVEHFADRFDEKDIRAFLIAHLARVGVPAESVLK